MPRKPTRLSSIGRQRLASKVKLRPDGEQESGSDTANDAAETDLDVEKVMPLIERLDQLKEKIKRTASYNKAVAKMNSSDIMYVTYTT